MTTDPLKLHPLILARLQAHKSSCRTWTCVAAQLGVSQSYLSDVVTGKRAAGPKLLALLGLRTVLTVEEVAICD